MPKFTKVPRGKGYWVKELLMTILATTISIVLTFGTAYQIDRREKKTAQRQMAMMIIHDIDNSIHRMEQADSIIREFDKLQLLILEGKYDKPISSARTDLSLCNPNVVKFSETTEQIFKTSVDTWNTIGKADFIDNVSNCYIDRAVYNQSIIDEFYKKLLPTDSFRELSELDELLDIDADFYVTQSSEIINRMKAANELNKRIMKVSDEDLEKFATNKMSFYKQAIDSLSKVSQSEYLEKVERKDKARQIFNKNRDTMYPSGASGRNK
jgi:hypothetical protein